VLYSIGGNESAFTPGEQAKLTSLEVDLRLSTRLSMTMWPVSQATFGHESREVIFLVCDANLRSLQRMLRLPRKAA